MRLYAPAKIGNPHLLIVPKRTEDCRVSGMPLELFRRMAKLTEHIKFYCDFEDGACKDSTRWNHGEATKGAGCCVRCPVEWGYFERFNEWGYDDKLTEQFRLLWDTDRGFWRPGIGCTLPREMRSPVCLRFSCGYDHTNVFSEKLMHCLNGSYYSKENVRELYTFVLNTPPLSTLTIDEMLESIVKHLEDTAHIQRRISHVDTVKTTYVYSYSNFVPIPKFLDVIAAPDV